MYRTKINESSKRLAYSLTVVFLALAALLFIVKANPTQASTATSVTSASVAAPTASFPGTGVGPIDDGPVGGTVCGDFGAPLNITFNVSGMTAPLTDVKVTLSGSHTWIGDLEVTLLAPTDTPSAIVFKNEGATTATACGDDSDLGGPYVFFDTAPAAPTFWGAGTTATGAVPIAAGSYRTSAAATGTNTTITPVFSGLTTGQINGTWTLRVRDGGEGDTGDISAATLDLTGGAAPTGDAPMDLDNDGKSDWVVVRNVGGGPSGQIRWFYNLNAGGATVAKDWGLATDFFIADDFDNDNKDDIVVWRSGAPAVAAFYVLRSSDQTAIVEPFGQTGDDPTVVDDYNNDGKADFAVYRAGVGAGDASTWFYRTTPGGVVNYVPWGQNGDFVAPGDYDGDGKADFVVQRNDGGGRARFWRRFATGATDTVVFGTPTDVICPGDWDGDGKTDIATLRGSGGSIQWFYLSSLNGSINYKTFGSSATDFVAQGDYDGDGKVEPGIWRPSATPGASAFWTLNSSNGAVTTFTFGANGDYPVANYNQH